MNTKLDRLIEKAQGQQTEPFPFSAAELDAIMDSADRYTKTNTKPKLRRIVMNTTISAAAAALMLTGYLAFNAPDATRQNDNNSIAFSVADAKPDTRTQTAPDINSNAQIHRITVIHNSKSDTVDDQLQKRINAQVEKLVKVGIANADGAPRKRLSSIISDKIGLLELNDTELAQIGVFKDENGGYYRVAEKEIKKYGSDYGSLQAKLQEKGYNTASEKLIVRQMNPLGFVVNNNELTLSNHPNSNDMNRINWGNCSVTITNSENPNAIKNDSLIKHIVDSVLNDRLGRNGTYNPNTNDTLSNYSNPNPTDSANISFKNLLDSQDVRIVSARNVFVMDNTVHTDLTDPSIPKEIQTTLNKKLKEILAYPNAMNRSSDSTSAFVIGNGMADTVNGKPVVSFAMTQTVTILGADGKGENYDLLAVQPQTIMPYSNWSMNAKSFPDPVSFEITSVSYKPNESNTGFDDNRLSFTSVSSGIRCADGSDATDKVLSGGTFNDCTSRLIGVRVFSGNDKVIKDSSDIKYNECTLWYEATPEFIDKLPERYKSSVLAEVSALDMINKGELSPSEACSRLNDEKRFLGVCGANSGAILSLNAYPMPAENSTNCFIELKEDRNITLSLYRSSGDLVKDFTSNQQFTAGKQSISLDVSGLQKGLYFLVAESSNGELAYMKFFVQ